MRFVRTELPSSERCGHEDVVWDVDRGGEVVGVKRCSRMRNLVSYFLYIFIRIAID
jgi:hypothetical protein